MAFFPWYLSRWYKKFVPDDTWTGRKKLVFWSYTDKQFVPGFSHHHSLIKIEFLTNNE
jgi:GH25 family lysozyme M1 (1,4-beta-N-acetylmuramidase)